MRVAMYVRVSKLDLNPENQLIQLEGFAKSKGWEYDLYEERETTRKTRPVKEQVMQACREGKYDGVLVWKIDRWARSLQELVMNVSELQGRGKHFTIMTTPIDTTSSHGMLMLQIMGAFAEFERELIRERTIAGLERARAQGKKLGRPRKVKK